MAAQMRQRFRDLPDVDWASFEDGEVATYDEGTDTLTGEEGGGSAGGDLAAHEAATEDVHGITDTSTLADRAFLNGPGELFVGRDVGGGEVIGSVLASGADGEVLTVNTADTYGVEWAAPDVTAAELAAHNADGTFVHGIPNTADLVTDADLSSHASDATGIHGITDTAALATDAEVAAAVAAHEADTSVHGIADTTVLATDAELASGLATKQSTSEKGQANGYASLGADAKIPTGQIAAIALTDVNVVASQAAQLALTAEEGDVAVRSDETKSYVHNGGTAGTMADWTLLQTPAGAVLSVNGETGAVTLDAADVGAASTSALSAHEADATNIHGIDDTAVLATDADIVTHAVVTTDVHGIADTTALALADNVIEPTILTAKGDLIVADDAVDPNNLEVGADGQVLSANSTETLGLEWVDPPAGDITQADLTAHTVDETDVHGIADTSALATLPVAEANVTGLTAALAAKQPVDSDLTAIAALTTTSFGRGVLEVANQAGLLSAAGAAAASHSHAQADVTNLTTDLAAKQPLDSDLTSLAALSTTSYGRSLLELADAAAHATSHADGGSAEIVTALDPLTFPSVLKPDRSYVTGQYYPACITAQGGLGGSGTQTVNKAIYTLFIVYTQQTFDRIGVYITVNASAGGLYRLGIYNDNNGVPGTVLLDAGTVATDAGAAAIKAITISQALAPGRYWAVSVAQTAAATVRRTIQMTWGSYMTTDWINGTYNTDNVSGALGNSPIIASNSLNPPMVGLRAA